jgi:hypothetical protein
MELDPLVRMFCVIFINISCYIRAVYPSRRSYQSVIGYGGCAERLVSTIVGWDFMDRRTVVGTMHCPDCERRLANVQGYETCADCGYVRPLDRSFPAR